MTSPLRGALSTLAYPVTWVTANGLRVLMYHRVTDAHPGERLCVPVARFEEQMRSLREEGYRTVSFAEAVRWVGGQGGALPAKSIVLTFDDGYADNFLHALPAMARCGFAGIFFIPTASMERPPRGPHPDDASMTWAQLGELLAAGHEIGAHSITHRKLTLIDPSDLDQEVRGCKVALEERLGRSVEFFCYPAGAYNQTVIAALRAAGYRGACTVEPGANRPGADVFALKRTEVSAFDSLWDFRKKLAGAYDWLHAAAQWRYRRSPRSRQHPSNVVMGNTNGS